MEWMARRGASVEGYINSITEQLRHLPGHLWTILFYCLQPRLGYWLRLLPVNVTRSATQAVDAALLLTAEAAGRPGMLTVEPRLDTLTPVSIDTWTLLDTIDTSDTSVNRHTPTPL